MRGAGVAGSALPAEACRSYRGFGGVLASRAREQPTDGELPKTLCLMANIHSLPSLTFQRTSQYRGGRLSGSGQKNGRNGVCGRRG